MGHRLRNMTKSTSLFFQTEESNRQQEEETRRRLAQETGRWQRHVLASARKEAEEKDGVKKREIREKVRRVGKG